MTPMGICALTAWVVILLLPIAGGQSTKKEALAALKEFERFIGNNNEHVRKAAVDGLAGTNHLLLIRPLMSALTDKSPLVRGSVPAILARQSAKDSLAELTRNLKRAGNPDVKIGIMEAFRVTQPKVAVNTLLALTEHKEFAVRLAAITTVGVYPDDDPRVPELLLQLTSDRLPVVRLTAIESLMCKKHPAMGDRCLELLKTDKDWRVKAMVVEALEGLRMKKSVTPLIDAMEQEKGRISDDCHHALVSLTGTTYSPNPDVWRRWWNRVEKNFTLPTLADLEERRRKIAASMAEYKGGKHRYPPYHGINTKSRRMLFIIDVSGSMADKVILTTQNETRLKAFRERYGEYEHKIDLAREELITTVATLPRHVRFNIATFHTSVKPWKPKLVAASQGNKNAAIKFLSKLTRGAVARTSTETFKTGKTNTFDALNFAFGLGKSKNKRASKNHKVESDTVFLVSDGMPTAGRLTDPGELLRYFNVINRRTKIVFHTIAFGHANSSLMQPIASASGGVYVEIGF